MGNRSPQHLKPGQRNLRGKKKMMVCPCCDPVIDHREKVQSALAELAMKQEPLGEDFERAYEDNALRLYSQ